MDQFMVDVTEIPDVKTGDEVTLLGKDGDEVISADTLGDLSGRFSYEFVCNISKRVPRVYIRDGKECGELTYLTEHTQTNCDAVSFGKPFAGMRQVRTI